MTARLATLGLVLVVSRARADKHIEDNSFFVE